MEILQEDLDLIKLRLKEIDNQLRLLADEFNVVLNQSSETWHDNAAWDDAKARERVLLAEQEYLQKVIRMHSVCKISDNSPVGKNHKLKFNGKELSVHLVGDVSLRVGQEVDGYKIVTKVSPVGKVLLNSSINLTT